MYSLLYMSLWGFPGCSDGKESAWNAGDLGLIPGLGRSPWGGHGNTLQYSCLENLMDRGAWQATVMGSHRVRRDWSDLACTCHTEAHLKATEKQKQKQNCYLWGNTIQVSTNTALSEAKLPSQIMVLIHQIFTEWLLCVKYYARDCGTCNDKCVCLLWSDFAALTERVAMVAP